MELLDARFERRLGPALVRWLYLSALAMIATVTGFCLLMSWWLASWAGWAFWLGVPISIATGLACALTVRLACEQLIRWTGRETPRRREHATAPPAWSSPPSSSHPSGSGPGPTGEGGAPHWVLAQVWWLAAVRSS
jgi:hypothetical protein